jgi:hypothetical protein
MTRGIIGACANLKDRRLLGWHAAASSRHTPKERILRAQPAAPPRIQGNDNSRSLTAIRERRGVLRYRERIPPFAEAAKDGAPEKSPQRQKQIPHTSRQLRATGFGMTAKAERQWPLAAEAASSSAAACGLCAAMTFSASSAGTKS